MNPKTSRRALQWSSAYPIGNRVVTMHITARQEQFSRAAVYAIASTAGCAVSERNVDDDSIDLTLCSKSLSRRPSIDLQLKCSGQNLLTATTVAFSLGLKNYDDLRIEDVFVPRLLLVTIVPPTLEEWLVQSEDQLLLRRCVYWQNLRGLPPIETGTITIHVPRTNVFTPAVLTGMMNAIHNEGQL